MAFEGAAVSHITAMEGRKHTSLDGIDTLLEHFPDVKIEQARDNLRRMTREELLQRLSFAYFKGERVKAFLINEALTAAGVPPCFRHLPDPDTADIVRRFDILLADLEWIANRYRDHHALYERYRRLFLPHAFHKTAYFIYYSGRTPAWKVVRGLALTIDQQWECHCLRSGSVSKRYRAMMEKRDRTFQKITDTVQSGRCGGRSREELNQTILRRMAIWECGWMAENRPQRTADLLHLKTGELVARNVVAKQLEKIDRALA